MSTATSTLADQVRERLADTALRIGTGTTPLALAQTDRVVSALLQFAAAPSLLCAVRT